jgi:hypothetical protein
MNAKQVTKQYTLLLTTILLCCPFALRAQPQRKTADERQQAKKLGQRLIRQNTGDQSDDIMDKIMRGMKQAAQRLDMDFDPGEETQQLQQQVVNQLNEAIKTAAARRRPSKRSQKSATSDKRKKLTKKTKQNDADPTKTGGKKSSGTSRQQAQADGGSPEDGPKGGRIDEIRRTWGHLPARERDEIIQGIPESFLERYRDWIERYYRALQESNQ